MSKLVKEMIIDDLTGRLGETRDMLVIDSSRVDAIADNRFRAALAAQNIRLLTVKNSLARRALNSLGVTALDPVLKGPSTLVWGGEDIVSLSKEITRWAKEFETLEVKGGALEGKTLEAADVDALSKSPSREQLIGRVVMLAQSPGRRLAGQLLGPGGKLAGQLKAIAEKESETETASA
jgi:large subunit ribosomal protein L10